MTTITSPAPGASLLQLARIELMKTWSTRSGIGLYAAIALLAVAAGAFTATSGPIDSRTLQHAFSRASGAMGLLLPVLALLLFTSEWSARTALTTFTLTPQRERIVAAKLMATCAITLAACAFGAICAVLILALAPHHAAALWSASPTMLAQGALVALITTLIGSALGACLLNTPTAMVTLYVAPTIALAVSLWPAAHGPMGWINQTTTIGPLTDTHLDAAGWAHVASGVGIWLLAPLAIGAARIMRSDVN